MWPSPSSSLKALRVTRRSLMLLLLLANINIGVFVVYYRGNSTKTNCRSPSLDQFEKGIKTILIWNSANRIETAVFGTGSRPFVEHGCPYTKCRIDLAGRDSLPLESYDAIVINMNELWFAIKEVWPLLPRFIRRLQLPSWSRRADQRLVFLTQEPPPYMPIDPAEFDDYFNWTMTYRLDSDIPFQYGRIIPTAEREIRKSPVNHARNKTRPVAWMSSHCHTHGGRENYVRQLSQFIDVDIYGHCGTLSCPRNESTWLSYPQCYRLMESTYKFYLSFENSVCQDYVTEKFFDMMQYDIVPVVYGGADYSRIAPPHSYIDAMKYDSAEQLADYLKLLDANDTLYNEYFRWKSNHRVESGVEQMSRTGFCELCRKLHEESGQSKSYHDLASQWHHQTQCKRHHV